MKIIVCLDDRNGMTFNHRRQSRDRLVVEDILQMVGDKALYLAEYSRCLFPDEGVSLAVFENYLEEAKTGDFCFVEDRGISAYADRIEEVVIYRWNRRYPFDLSFDLDLNANGFVLAERAEFPGFSHETITKEIFRK